MSTDDSASTAEIACACGAIDLPSVEIQHNDETTAHTVAVCRSLGVQPCGQCEDGCVHGTTTPCPHCRGRMVIPPESRAT